MESGTGVATPAPEDLDQLEQEPTALPAVPVRLVDAVNVYALPSRYVQYSTDSVGDTYVALLPLNIKRAKVTLIATGQPMVVSDTNTGGGMAWPVNVPLVLTNTRPVYVKSGTAGTPAVVGACVEIWAD